MGGCSAVGCSSRNEKGKKLHNFPRDPDRRKVWEKMVRRRNWKAHDRSKLCEDHFDESQYESRRMDNLRKLRPNAVPTKFTHFQKSKVLRDLIEQLAVKTVVENSLLLKRHCLEHSYSQSLEQWRPQHHVTDRGRQATGDLLLNSAESQIEEQAGSGPFTVTLCPPIPLCPAVGEGHIKREDVPTEELGKAAEHHKSAVALLREATRDSVDATAIVAISIVDNKVAALKDVIKKRDGRIAQLLKALARERRERHKLEREKHNLTQNVAKVFNANQLARLGRASGRGVRWSRETTEKALQLRLACGVKGYALLRAQNQPLPSLRCLRRTSNTTRTRRKKDAHVQETASAVDCLQASISSTDLCTMCQ